VGSLDGSNPLASSTEPPPPPAGLFRNCANPRTNPCWTSFNIATYVTRVSMVAFGESLVSQLSARALGLDLLQARCFHIVLPYGARWTVTIFGADSVSAFLNRPYCLRHSLIAARNNLRGTRNRPTRPSTRAMNCFNANDVNGCMIAEKQENMLGQDNHNSYDTANRALMVNNRKNHAHYVLQSCS